MVQEKVLPVLGHLPWLMTVNNNLSSSGCGDKEVQEMMQYPDIALDNISNTCLCDDTSDEKKLLKDTNAKQKSKLTLSGLQHKSSNNSGGTLYNNQEQRPSLQVAGRLKHFQEN